MGSDESCPIKRLKRERSSGSTDSVDSSNHGDDVSKGFSTVNFNKIFLNWGKSKCWTNLPPSGRFARPQILGLENCQNRVWSGQILILVLELYLDLSNSIYEWPYIESTSSLTRLLRLSTSDAACQGFNSGWAMQL